MPLRRYWPALIAVAVLAFLVGTLLLPERAPPPGPDAGPGAPAQGPSRPSVITKWIFNPGWILGPPTDRELIAQEIVKRASLVTSGEALPGTPDLQKLSARLIAQRLTLGAPIFMRIFKREFELELWMRKGGRFERFAVYPICNWSGDLGPKQLEGDRQSPEGFYTVDARSLNAKSSYHRSFNLGFPNAYDRAHNRTGSFIMVHGACASVGCYAMTNPVIEEIWTIVQAALGAGQRRFHVHVFPFRMTPENFDKYRNEPWQEFWQNLREGYDAFETAKLPPRISVCNRRYIVATASPNSVGSEEIVSCMDPAADRSGLSPSK